MSFTENTQKSIGSFSLILIEPGEDSKSEKQYGKPCSHQDGSYTS